MKLNLTALFVMVLSTMSSVLSDEQERPMEANNLAEAAVASSIQSNSRNLQEKNGCQICHETGDCSNAMLNGPGFACPAMQFFQVCCPPEHTCDGFFCKAPPTECEICGETGQCDKAYFGNPGIFCRKTEFMVYCCGKGDICGPILCEITKDSEFHDETEPPESSTEPTISEPSTTPTPTTTTKSPTRTTKSPSNLPSESDLDIDPDLDLGSFNSDDFTPKPQTTPTGGIGKSVSSTLAYNTLCLILVLVSVVQLVV